MRYTLFTSAALVASASLSLAAPANIVARSGFEIKQVKVGTTVRNGPKDMMKTYNKFAKNGAVAPADVVAAAAAQQSGSVTASPVQNDSEYLCPVTIGNSQLTLDFDTGSADLWVFSTQTPNRGSYGAYNPSTGRKLAGSSWSITYGDGSGASGDVYADKAVIGGVTATSQAIEAATSVSTSFANGKSDGLVGLAFSSINTVTPQPQTTFFDTVKSTLKQALFTADLKAGEPGSYTFGSVLSYLLTGVPIRVLTDRP